MKTLLSALPLCCLLLPTVLAGEYKIAKDVVIYEATVAETKIKVVASERPYDPARPKTAAMINRSEDGKQPFKPATVDGKEVVGTDSNLPPVDYPQLDRLSVLFGGKEVSVRQDMLHRVFNPDLSEKTAVFDPGYAGTIVSVSRDAKCVIVDLGVGDGGGSTTTKFIISIDGKVTTRSPQRPGDP
jgi:hypothetical protein